MGYKRKRTKSATPPSFKMEEVPKVEEESEEDSVGSVSEGFDDGHSGSAEEPKGPSARAHRRLERTTNVVFIRGLPPGLEEEELRGFLSQYGPVKRVRVPRSRKTGRVRGYAFVQFQESESADTVALELHGLYVYGHVLKARRIDPSRVDPTWPSAKALIALDRRIRILGLPRKRPPQPPQKAITMLERRTKSEKKRNKRLKELGVSYSSDFWTNADERAKRIAHLKDQLQRKLRPKAEVSKTNEKKKGTAKKMKVDKPAKPTAQLNTATGPEQTKANANKTKVQKGKDKDAKKKLAVKKKILKTEENKTSDPTTAA